ncbi:MAG: AAA family ATPase [Desulfobacterales bacterium]|nr:AAA family ATPase [Desulfobacterales bacterium]
MKLTAISFENYKSFQKRQSIEIRPLTILIGRNSSGKSVIARLPLLLARSLSNRAESPLDFEFDGLDFGSSFSDFVHNRRPHGDVSIGANFLLNSGNSLKFFSKIQHFDEYRLQIVSYFNLECDDYPVNINMLWAGNDPNEEYEYKRYQIEGAEHSCEASFRGIFPYDIELDNSYNDVHFNGEQLFGLKMLIGELLENITYLGPFRRDPKRVYRFPGGIMKNVGFSGERAPELLGHDFLRQKGKVLSAVGDWFSKHLGGWPLDLSQQGDMFSLVLRNPENPSMEINIADVGTGIAQVLPIVVQRQFEAVTGTKSSLEIVEQPELHLHPGAHGDLADLYVNAVQNSGISFIIETHSENFILRIRRRIAEGKLDPEKVIIYWINDEPGSVRNAEPIHIKADGEVDFWPTKVFAEDFEEVRAIRKAQKGYGS